MTQNLALKESRRQLLGCVSRKENEEKCQRMEHARDYERRPISALIQKYADHHAK